MNAHINFSGEVVWTRYEDDNEDGYWERGNIRLYTKAGDIEVVTNDGGWNEKSSVKYL